MSFELKDKVALVTGAAAGIGFNSAKQLLRNGVKGVALIDVNPKFGQEALETLSKEFGENRVIFVLTDVSNMKSFEDAFRRTINRFKNIDILINNAGFLDDRFWEKEIDVNIKGTIHGIILGLENYLQKYRSTAEAVIVNISSIAGIEPYKEIPLYTGTKHAIYGMSKAWGHEMHYQRTKVKILTICPNATNTSMSTKLNEKCFKAEYGKAFLEVVDALPQQSPEDVAMAIMKIIQNGKPGSGWLVEGGKDPKEIQMLLKFNDQ